MGSIIAAITLCQRGWKINRKVFQSKTTLPCMTHTALHLPHKKAWVLGLEPMPYFPSGCASGEFMKLFFNDLTIRAYRNIRQLIPKLIQGWKRIRVCLFLVRHF